MFQLKDNSGNLFVNQKKQTEKHPDFQGTLKIGEQEYYVSAWKKSGQKGEYLSLAVKVKEPKEMPF